MIKDKSRAGWFGASDTAIIMGNWNTATFYRWWLVKLRLAENNFGTRYMRAGTEYEHKILRKIGIEGMDRQIKIRRLRLRVNLDGEDAIIHEVKTYSKPVFRVSKTYWMQAQVEMYAAKKQLRIVAYRMDAENYINFFLPIDMDRISYHPIAYDYDWVHIHYLPRLKYLARCMRKGVMPNESDYQGYVDRLGKSKANRFLRFGLRLLGGIRSLTGQGTRY